MGRLQFVLLMPSWRGWGFGKFRGKMAECLICASVV